MSSTIETVGGIQIIEGRNLTGEIPEGVVEYRKTATVLARPWPVPFKVLTPEGEMLGEAGDYLVSDNPPTHYWTVKRGQFEATHAPV